MSIPAVLALEDGSFFEGISIGVEGVRVAELVFNTSMMGYQEVLTDPSYAGQIITFSYPHIGNVGVNADDDESDKAWIEGLVLRDFPQEHSNWRAQLSLGAWLQQQQVVAMAEVDTRALTHLLRKKGSLRACIVTGEMIDLKKAHAKTRDHPSLLGSNLADEVSTQCPYHWSVGSWQSPNQGVSKKSTQKTLKALVPHIVVFDFGVKKNILRKLVDSGARLTVLPSKSTFEEVLSLKPDGVFLSNGPGDPAACNTPISTVQKLLELKMPLMGLCFGHQILALSAGAKTKKMKFGHHGVNHPIRSVDDKVVFISSQNHGFTVDENTLPEHVLATHHSLFDGSLQGIRFLNQIAIGFQGHPEANPGPRELSTLFEIFIQAVVKENFKDKHAKI